MTLHLYLRLLLRLRALLMVLLGVLGFSFVIYIPQKHPPDTLAFLVLVTTVPFILGAHLAGAAHEPQHRPFALLLPGLHRALRRFSLFALVGLTLLLTLQAWWCRPDVPPLAVGGLVAAQLALPFANRRSHRRDRAGYLLGLAILLVWGALLRGVDPRLPELLSANPYAFALLGSLCAVSAFTYGFAPAARRARATSPYTPFYHGSTAQLRYNAEVRALHAQRPPDHQAQRWQPNPVGHKRGDWIRMLDWQRAMTARKVTQINLLTAATITLFMLGMHAYTHSHSGAPNTSFLELLGNLLAPTQAHFDDFPSVILFMSLFSGGYASGQMSRPLWPYPLGRHLLAQAVYLHCLITQVRVLVSFLVVIASMSLLGQLSTGHWQPWGGLQALAEFGVMIAALIPWLAAFAFRTKDRLGAMVLSGLPALMGSLAIVAIRCGTWSLAQQLLIYCLSMFVLALGAWLMWLSIHRHYATCDLAAEPALANALGK